MVISFYIFLHKCSVVHVPFCLHELFRLKNPACLNIYKCRPTCQITSLNYSLYITWLVVFFSFPISNYAFVLKVNVVQVF